LNRALSRFRGDSFKEAVAAVVQVLKLGKVNAGSLGSRLADSLEAGTGKKIYPPRWSVMPQRWDVVSH